MTVVDRLANTSIDMLLGAGAVTGTAFLLKEGAAALIQLYRWSHSATDFNQPVDPLFYVFAPPGLRALGYLVLADGRIQIDIASPSPRNVVHVPPRAKVALLPRIARRTMQRWWSTARRSWSHGPDRGREKKTRDG